MQQPVPATRSGAVSERAVTPVQKHKPSLTPMELQAARLVVACTKWDLELRDPGSGAQQLPDCEIQDRPQRRAGILQVRLDEDS